VPSFCHDCRLERDPASVGRSPCPGCGSTRVDAVVYAQPAYATATAHPATVVTTSTGRKGAQGRAEASVRVEGTAIGHRNRVVEETGVVVRVIRWDPPLKGGGRRYGFVEDEHGNLRELGAGDTPADSALEWIISGALLPDEGE
jgi:hypothetical protein